MNRRSLWLCGIFARIHARASPQIHRKLRQSVTNISLLALGANPSPCLFVLFSCTLSVVFCVSVKKCEIPLAGDERNYQTIWVDWVVDIVGVGRWCIVTHTHSHTHTHTHTYIYIYIYIKWREKLRLLGWCKNSNIRCVFKDINSFKNVLNHI